MHCLEPAEKGKNLYNIIEPICFKVGEVIDIPGTPDKALAQRLEPVGKAAEKLLAAADNPPPPDDPPPPDATPPDTGDTTPPEDGDAQEDETHG